MSEGHPERWGDGPVWILGEADGHPRCEDHNETFGPVNFTPVIASQEYHLRDGVDLYYCAGCFGDPDTLATESQDVLAAFVSHLETHWDDVQPFFEHAGDATHRTLSMMLNPYDEPGEAVYSP